MPAWLRAGPSPIKRMASWLGTSQPYNPLFQLRLEILEERHGLSSARTYIRHADNRATLRPREVVEAY